MQEKSSDPPQQWSVHAHFTISHPGIDDPNANQQTHTDRDENGVHMSYSWSSQSTAAQDVSTPVPGLATSDKVQPSYGFQKGNLLFTSTPPRRCFINHPEGHLLNVARNVQDSGYNSALLSPNSCISNPRRSAQTCNHKCKSTCSIVLSTTINEQPELEDALGTESQCSRTQSLRCQTPAVKSDRGAPYYGCGDPWCHHSSYNDVGPFSPTQGSETSCSTGQTVMHKPLQEFKKIGNVEERKDAAVQTFEMVDKCTSPFMMVDSVYLKNEASRDEILKKDKYKKRFYSNRSKTEPLIMQTNSQSSFTPDSLENYEPRKRLIRQSATKFTNNTPLISNTKTSLADSKSSDSTKKPRTVHIDVYCTGTEQESETSSSEIDSKTASSPQTVFESEKVRVTHSRSDDKALPAKLKDNSQVELAPKILKVKTDNESDDDNTSTAYPSQISSYSAIGALSSFASSVPASWSTYSIDNDSVANTSWKDTFSDFDSVNRSRSSIALTESLEFVPRRFAYSQKSDSIEEQPELDSVKKLGPQSSISLNPSDSFEYANSEDKLRIKRMDEMWSTKHSKQWKSPHTERKHFFQQQKLKEYMDKRLKGVVIPKQESRESDSESDHSEKGWSFVKNDKDKTHSSTKVESEVEATTSHKLTVPLTLDHRRSPTIRSPSVLALQQKLTLNPTLRSPFMIVPGIFTDQRSIAKKFGSVVEVYKKPGHHIGPAKNPECQCDHCKSFFNQAGRGRARSLGESSSLPWLNWRKNSRPSQSREPKDA